MEIFNEPVTVERVQAAYRKTGLRAKAHTYYSREERCACALGVLILSEGSPDQVRTFKALRGKPLTDFVNALVPHKEVYSFTEGFDGDMAYHKDLQDEAAWRLGIEIAKATITLD